MHPHIKHLSATACSVDGTAALCAKVVSPCALLRLEAAALEASTIPVSADSKDRPHKPACAKEQQAHRQALNAHAQLVWSNIVTHTHMHNKDPG